MFREMYGGVPPLTPTLGVLLCLSPVWGDISSSSAYVGRSKKMESKKMEARKNFFRFGFSDLHIHILKLMKSNIEYLHSRVRNDDGHMEMHGR